MLCLGIDSSTMTGSVALLSDDALVGEYALNLRRTHSERLMVAVEHLLVTAGVTLDDVDLICTAVGPGSYTGVRIGVTTAKMLAWAKGKPLVGVCTLEAMARMGEGMGTSVTAVPAIAAKGTLVFAGAYRVGGADRVAMEPQPIDVNHLVQGLMGMPGSILPLGDGFLSHEGAFAPLADAGRLIRLPSHRILPRASYVAEVGRESHIAGGSADPSTLAPLYLREPEAETAWARKQQGV